MTFGYLAALLVSLSGLVALDAKHKLAFFVSPKRSLVTLLVPYLFFILWDAFGIGFGIFFRGQTRHLIGVEIFPEFPVEELLFLAVLCYTTLLSFAAIERRRK